MGNIRNYRRTGTVFARDEGDLVSLEIMKPAEFFAPENRPNLVGLRMISYGIDQDLFSYIDNPDTNTDGLMAFDKLLVNLRQAVSEELKKRELAPAG